MEDCKGSVEKIHLSQAVGRGHKLRIKARACSRSTWETEKDPKFKVAFNYIKSQSGLQETLSQRTNKQNKNNKKQNKRREFQVSWQARHVLPSGCQTWISGGHFIAPALGRRLRHPQESYRQQLQTKSLLKPREGKGNGQTQNVLSALGQILRFEVSGSVREVRPVSQEQD